MNTSDPRLTAHALGEADTESAEHIAHDPALAAEAENTRIFAERLRADFRAEAAPALCATRRATILAEAKIAAGPARWWQHGWALGSAAACLALALGAAIYFQARHVDSLRGVASDQPAAPQSVNVRWTDDTRALPPEIVAAPQAPVPTTRPTFQGPAPIATRPQPPAPHAPTVATRSTPAPPSGILPADPERINAAPLKR